ncbi:MAG TPA: TetR/AcrR family transcriptional regulator [Burkholderiaceae bacterium]|nr:TetR/AcrR family transcriptional regulator [Burkholderiaceae bacterium]
MRIKSQTRREVILATALDLFREVGFEAASMSQIAARAGGSKTTLYNHFSSKEELLLEALLTSAREYAQEVRQLLQESDDLPTQLHRFVFSLLKLINDPATIEIMRVAVSVGGTTDIGLRFYEMGTQEPWQDIANVLRQELERRKLPADPELMAKHLRDLCQTDVIANLLGAGKPLTDQETQDKAAYIVDLFLRAHGISDPAV